VIERLVVVGATGDLVGRFIAPALVQLHAAGTLPEDLEVVAVARHELDTATFVEHLREELEEHGEPGEQASRDAVLGAFRYHRADSTDAGALAGAFEGDGPVVVYLALPPTVFEPTLDALDEVGLPDGSRIVLEKPFGEDLADARRLNARIRESFQEDRIHRVDHFLGMRTVQNVVALRFANRIFEPVWNRQHIERIEVVWDESLALEGRAGYYDGTGALVDVLQNHLLQVLAVVAMEPPASLSEQDLREAKATLLRAVRRMSVSEAAEHSRRARYTAGTLDGREVPSYVDEEGVDPEEGTETFAEVTLHIDNERWEGVAFRLRTGKALARDRREVVVRFRDVPSLDDGAGPSDEPTPPTELCIGLEPAYLRLGLNVRASDDRFALDRTDLRAELAASRVPAYSRVLRAVLEGDPTLSIRGDEAEWSWEIVEPVLEAWRQGHNELLDYEAGTDGPTVDR
jgi:glucose-6-phosphate 1-dehydrogenase